MIEGRKTAGTPWKLYFIGQFKRDQHFYETRRKAEQSVLERGIEDIKYISG